MTHYLGRVTARFALRSFEFSLHLVNLSFPLSNFLVDPLLFFLKIGSIVLELELKNNPSSQTQQCLRLLTLYEIVRM